MCATCVLLGGSVHCCRRALCVPPVCATCVLLESGPVGLKAV